MSSRSKFFLFVFVALGGLFFLFWLFNVCAYNFWLANQNIAGRETYEQRLYWMLALFLLSMVLEVWAIWKAAKFVKSLNGQPSSAEPNTSGLDS